MESRALSRFDENNMSFSVRIQSESTMILSYVLNNTSPPEFYNMLLTAINSPLVMQSDVDNLLKLLQAMGLITSVATQAAHDEIPRHCVRCHHQYLEKHNGWKACTIRHDQPQRIIKADSHNFNGTPVWAHFYACCRKQTDLATVPNVPHFQGRHTTTTSNVEYNDSNVLTCDKKKCQWLGTGSASHSGTTGAGAGAGGGDTGAST
jgi:hypothetical protein